MTEETTEALTQEEKKIPTRRNLDMIKLAPEIEGVEIEILNFDDQKNKKGMMREKIQEELTVGMITKTVDMNLRSMMIHEIERMIEILKILDIALEKLMTENERKN